MSSSPQPAGAGAAPATQHKVQPGETLSVIAQKRGVILKALLAANTDIKDPNLIKVGQMINLPPGQVVVPTAPVVPAQPATPPAASSPAAGAVSAAFAGMDARGKAQNVHPLLRERLTMLAGILAQSGMKALITDGRRTFAEQEKIFQIGRRGIPGERIVTKARGGQSNHNYGLAVDMYPVLPDSTGKERVFTDIPKHSSVEFAHAFNRVQRAIGEQAEGLGLFWGARFSGIVDTPHIQLVAESDLKPSECRRILDAHNGDLNAVWDEATKRAKSI